uniref:Ig-like domain-containing protein n=1 Tax=Angiostrongylus cantonensis TaxID=6313 RepID=A0A0K0DG13_ANGCA
LVFYQPTRNSATADWSVNTSSGELSCEYKAVRGVVFLVTHTDRALLVVDALVVVIAEAVLVPGAQTIGAALLQMETAVRAADLVHHLHNSKQRIHRSRCLLFLSPYF